jgi:hypothetical protein
MSALQGYKQVVDLVSNPIVSAIGYICMIAVPFIFLGIYYYYSKHPEKRFLE